MTNPSTKVERLAQGRVQCSITFGEEQRAKGEASALQMLAAGVTVDGFRPGKAPLDVVRQRVNPERLLEETIRALLPETISALAAEHKITSIIPPRIEAVSENPLQVRLTFVEKPAVTLNGAEKIKVDAKPVAVDDKDVERVVAAMRDEYKTAKEVDRPAKSGDQVTVDFWAEDAEKNRIEQLTATQYQAVIGSNTLLPGMEDGMIGLTKGAAKDVTVTLPEKHQLEALRGKSLTFHITASKVEELSAPELNDAFAQEKFQLATLQALKDEVRSTLEREEATGERVRREREVLDALRKATTVDLAPELLEAEERVMLEDLRQRLEEQGLDFAEWVKRSGKTNEEIAKDLRERATERLTLRFGLEKLIEQKNVAVSEQEMDAAIRQQLQRFPEDQRIDAASLFQKGEDGYVQLEWQTKVEKALADYLK